jgi:hypothetical protein
MPDDPGGIGAPKLQSDGESCRPVASREEMAMDRLVPRPSMVDWPCGTSPFFSASEYDLEAELDDVGTTGSGEAAADGAEWRDDSMARLS